MAYLEEQSRGGRIIDFPLVAMLVAVLLYACAAGLAVFLERILPPMPANTKIVVDVLLNVGLLLATYKLAIRHLGEVPRDDLPAEGALRNLALGVLCGALLMVAIVGVAYVLGIYRITDCCRTGLIVRDLFAAGVLAAFAEELLFRGILFRWIEEFAGSWIALILTSALFGLVHIENPNAGWFSSFAIAVEAGVLLGGAYMLTRNLWAPMGLHAAWNFTQGYIFDVPVSGVPEEGLVQAKLSGPALLTGGQFGLEASLLGLLIATAAGAALVIVAAHRGEIVQPWWVRRSRISETPTPERLG
jgi:membrane protease YdiL (CAAX protease family)